MATSVLGEKKAALDHKSFSKTWILPIISLKGRNLLPGLKLVLKQL